MKQIVGPFNCIYKTIALDLINHTWFTVYYKSKKWNVLVMRYVYYITDYYEEDANDEILPDEEVMQRQVITIFLQ